MKNDINEQAANLLDEYYYNKPGCYTVGELIKELKKYPFDAQVRVGEEYNNESLSRIIKVEYNEYNDNVQIVID